MHDLDDTFPVAEGEAILKGEGHNCSVHFADVLVL